MARNIVKILDKDFSDMKAGQRMYISSPEEVAAYIDAIPHGQTRTSHQMRAALAKRAGADVTCPVSTGIFLRLAIENVLGIFSLKDVPLPFWRLIDDKHPVVKKLGLLPKDIADMRVAETTS